MFRSMSFFTFLGTAMLLLGISACSGDDTESRVEQISRDIKVLDCMRLSYFEEIESVWDSVERTMATELPEAIPLQERENMLNVRNAELIRMFESYAGLPGDVKSLVDYAETEDQRIVGEFQRLMAQRQALEVERLALFVKIEEESPEKLALMRALFERIMNENCT